MRDVSSAHIRTKRDMGKRRNRVCGADVHKDTIVATIQSKEERLEDGIATIVDAFYHLKRKYPQGGG